MQTLEYAKLRLRTFLDELSKLAEAEFPYAHSEMALEKMQRLFERKLGRLQSFGEDADPQIVRNECALALHSLFLYLPLAGFILRSTNVRNAFEIFRPLLRLSSQVLEPGMEMKNRRTRLVLSSEWDYSPFIYREIPDLPGFVLIGLPAPESSNPLLIPLAGHELGHSICGKDRLPDQWLSLIKGEVISVIKSRWAEYIKIFPGIIEKNLTTDMFAIETWKKSVEWCKRQAEESFCDFVGLKIFNAAFLHAFAYLLSPNAGPRSASYPNMERRVANLLKAAEAYGIPVSADYGSVFEDDPASGLTESDQFRISVADEALNRLIPTLISSADQIIEAVHLAKVDNSEVMRIQSRFARVVPAEHCKGLPDILNAAWKASEDPDLWKDMPDLLSLKHRTLKELVLKNIEVFEIEQIIQEAT